MENSDKILDLDQALTKIGFGKFNIIYLLICGLLNSCDAIELMVLTFLGPIMSCNWNISVYEQSFLTTSVFIGMFFGGPIFGKLCDMYGRKSILAITTTSLAYLGILSSLSPQMIWIFICRGLIGTCIGGVISSISTLTPEVNPIKYRGQIISFMFFFWCFGSYFVTVLCNFIEPKFGWRIFLLITSIPLIVALGSVFWLPESPHFLLLKQRKSEALAVINRIAKLNNVDIIKDIHTSKPMDYSIKDLIHPNYRTTTILCIMLWFTSGLNYFGIVLFVTVINNIPHNCLQDFSQTSLLLTKTNGTESCCTKLTWESYKEFYISTTGELCISIITILLISHLPRKIGLMVYTAVITVLFLFLNFCLPHYGVSIILFILRGFIYSTFLINYIYATEVFPTSVRSLGVGICNGASRVGAMISPFIINIVVAQLSFFGGTMIFIIANIIVFFCAFSLPYETKNRKLYQTAMEPIEIEENDQNTNYENVK